VSSITSDDTIDATINMARWRRCSGPPVTLVAVAEDRDEGIDWVIALGAYALFPRLIDSIQRTPHSEEAEPIVDICICMH
jgi:hypothetical protein